MIVFENVCGLCKKKWQRSIPISLSSIPKINEKKQEQNEIYLTDMTLRFKQLQKNSELDEIDQCFRHWMKHNTVWNLSWLSQEEQDQFYYISKQFMADARAFDPDMKIDDIGQALRNVWIMLILMKVFDRDLCYHKAIFAYSMLYPYTDNFLDDTTISSQDKNRFNTWLSKRLQGELLTYENEDQQTVDTLVNMIEATFPRNKYPQVYEALQRIQGGQIKSVLQNSALNNDVLLDISIEKGGASVYADGYLIDGTMSDSEAIFSVAFGFLLQLADDIQDIHIDRKANYRTLISNKKHRKERVRFCSAYLHFIEVVVHELCPSKNVRLKTFIIENCRLLILFSLVQNAQYYTKLFLFRIQKRLPFHTNYLHQFMVELESLRLDDIDMHQQFDQYLQGVH